MKTLDTTTRIQVKNVLFLTDFSPAAAAALPYAAEVTKRFDAKLYALHVTPPVINPMSEPSGWPAMEKAAKVQSDLHRQELLHAFSGIHPEVMIEEGDFWQILNSSIEKNRIDLVVLGTRGRSGVRKFFLGSKAEEVFRQVPCAVLTVGPESHPHLRQTGEFTEILYATDFAPESAVAATYAICLAEEFQAHLTLLHVIPQEKPGELVRGEDLVAASRHLLRGLLAREAEAWCEPKFVVEEGPAAETILRVAAERKTDLIVLGVHRPNGFPGATTHLPIATAHKVVSQATCPVLTLHG
jgi:nucleotide-binding universal stress UspA family protein